MTCADLHLARHVIVDLQALLTLIRDFSGVSDDLEIQNVVRGEKETKKAPHYNQALKTPVEGKLKYNVQMFMTYVAMKTGS